MPRLIFKCPYIKGGGQRAAAHLENYVSYVATRPGVVHTKDGESQQPATAKQKKMIVQVLRDFPLSKGMFEYEDYQAFPTRANATEFISRALEENLDRVAKKENYLQYIAQRPNVQSVGSHGLFTGSSDPLVLSKTAKEVANHPGNVWLPIISLKREDAARLGYDNVQNWQDLLSSCAMEIAEAMKIPWNHFRWYAAFHDQGHHPHVHMVCYSADPKYGYLSKEGIAQIKSMLAKKIFRQELTEIYTQQTQRRDALTQKAGAMLEELIQQMKSGTLENERVGQLLEQLADRLRNTTGKKQYGYLKVPLKSIVDEIVDELAKDSRVSAAYDLWYELREEVLRTYKDDLPERLPLSKQKEFKRIKNLVIEEAVRLGDLCEPFQPQAEENADAQENEPESDQEKPPNQTESLPHMMWSRRYKEARRCRSDGNHASAFDLLMEEARKGSALAMFDLGHIYADGLGRNADKVLAKEWYVKALRAFQAIENEGPNQYAEYRLGKMYRDGIGTEKDINMAIEWFVKAAEQDNSFAAFALGKLFQDGDGVRKDLPLALEWMRFSAELGNQYAQYRLGKLLLQGDDVPKDAAEAVSWLKESAEQGNQYAQYALGKLYLMGNEVPQDQDEAVRWFTMSAAQGNEYAQYFLDHRNDWAKAVLFRSATQLLHYMGSIFREQNPPAARGPRLVDRKLRQKMRDKRLAMGHKADDHADQGINQQFM